MSSTSSIVDPAQNGHRSIQRFDGSPPRAQVPKRLFSLSQTPDIAAFKELCDQSTLPETYPHAVVIEANIPIYDLASKSFRDAELVDQLQDEWHHILMSGPGVMVLRNFMSNTPSVIEVANDVFATIIDSEASCSSSTSSLKKGDHFAASGKNARIWNSFQKHAERSPASFVTYYSNPWLAAVCDAWLGPAYQVTAQVNVVRPGGAPQVPHRDYHLGFQTGEACVRYPRRTQVASQFLTLQGAVAHSDMPLASGPTRFLPFSQQFDEGYMAYRLAEFQEFFAANWVSVALKSGDAVFFNPALFHAAGENRTPDIHRSANLLQVSSAFGKTMETIDTLAIVGRCWDHVRKLYAQQQSMMSEEVHAILNAVGCGYPFPTNLDRRPPAPGGMAPENEIDVLCKALVQGWDTEKVVSALTTIREDSAA